MPVTPPFTDGNDILNAYIRLEGSTGPVGNEVDLILKGKTFDAGAGVDTWYIDAQANKLGNWFTLTATEAGIMTLTNASGGAVKVSNIEKLEFQDVTINLGTVAADKISGTASSDKFLFGLGGADTINGLSGADALYGGLGADSLLGGAGADTIVGGAGRDVMTGGADKDIFDFNVVTDTGKAAASRDVIKDFGHLVDRIDLKTLDANTKTAGDQAFKFIGTQAFHKVAGEVQYMQIDAAGTANDKTIIMGDINGDAAADFQIELTGLKTLTASDFIL